MSIDLSARPERSAEAVTATKDFDVQAVSLSARTGGMSTDVDPDGVRLLRCLVCVPKAVLPDF
jgi:hypothetical protein